MGLGFSLKKKNRVNKRQLKGKPVIESSQLTKHNNFQALENLLGDKVVDVPQAMSNKTADVELQGNLGRYETLAVVNFWLDSMTKEVDDNAKIVESFDFQFF